MVDACDRQVRAKGFRSLEAFYRTWAPGFDARVAKSNTL